MDERQHNPYAAPEARIIRPDPPRRTSRRCIVDVVQGTMLLTLAGTPLAVGFGLLAMYVRDVIGAPDNVSIPISAIGTNLLVVGGLYAGFFIPLSILGGTFAGLFRPRLASGPVWIAGFAALTMLLPLGVAAFAPQHMRLTVLSGIAQGISLPYTIPATFLVWLFARKRPVAGS